MTRPLILVSNDDGVDARGLRAQVAALEKLGEIWVVAPDGERSTSSHSFTLSKPVAVRQVGERTFAVDGWPADCVYLGLFELLPRRPDVVVSGINFGANMGTDVLYSGTVAAAREAFTRGVPAIASSLVEGEDYDLAARFTAAVASDVIALGGEPPLLLNINVPGPAAQEVRVTRLGRRIYPEHAVVCGHRGEQTLYRLGVGAVQDALLPGSDGEALASGAISITPLQIDTTAVGHSSTVERLATVAWERLVEV